MPNHVTTRCIVTGPSTDVDAFQRSSIVTRLEDREDWWPADRVAQEFTRFDFAMIIPMPAVLDGSLEGGMAPIGYALVVAVGSSPAPYDNLGLYDHEIQRIRAEAGLPRDAAIDKVAAAYLALNPDVEALGRKRLQALHETGFASWYPWSIKNWGTKWNSYSFVHVGEAVDGSNKRLEFLFETAWSFPQPIFETLVAAYPSLDFECLTFDEGSMFAGRGHFAAGATSPYQFVEPTDELYQLVYGRPRERDEDDDG